MDTKNRTNAELLTRAMLLIFRANGHLLQAGDDLVAPYGLTSARWQVLGALWGKPSTVSEVARMMGLTRQSVQRTADTLEEEKFISFESNPNHARAPLLSLSPKGKTTLEKATDAQKEWSKRLAKSHSSDDLHSAITVLEKLIQSLEQDRKESKK